MVSFEMLIGFEVIVNREQGVLLFTFVFSSLRVMGEKKFQGKL